MHILLHSMHILLYAYIIYKIVFYVLGIATKEWKELLGQMADSIF